MVSLFRKPGNFDDLFVENEGVPGHPTPLEASCFGPGAQRCYRFHRNDNNVKVYVTVNVLDVRGRLDLSWGVSHPRFSPSSFSN
eukprot:scaffold4235_cov114-Isochrysis_galbana.AAC.12